MLLEVHSTEHAIDQGIARGIPTFSSNTDLKEDLNWSNRILSGILDNTEHKIKNGLVWGINKTKFLAPINYNIKQKEHKVISIFQPNAHREKVEGQLGQEHYFLMPMSLLDSLPKEQALTFYRTAKIGNRVKDQDESYILTKALNAPKIIQDYFNWDVSRINRSGESRFVNPTTAPVIKKETPIMGTAIARAKAFAAQRALEASSKK